jgi:branched-chain amino acid transport system permease protein
MAFIICTAYASVSGVLLMMVVRSADATDPTGYYALITSLNILAAVIIGGYKSIWGAVFGTFVMYGIKLVIFNQIPFLAKNSLIITLVSGILVIFIAMYYPGGLAQLLLEAKTKIKSTIKKIKEGIYGKDLG